MTEDIEGAAAALVADGKGILAVDESVGTLTRRFEAVGIQSTERSRRAYRETLFTTRGASEFIRGAILYDETIRQKSSNGTPMAEVLSRQGIVPGIKVDTGTVPLAGSPDETVTGSTGCAAAWPSIARWEPGSRSGARSSGSAGTCRARPASARMPMPSHAMPRSARNGSSCRSSSPRC